MAKGSHSCVRRYENMVKKMLVDTRSGNSTEKLFILRRNLIHILHLLDDDSDCNNNNNDYCNESGGGLSGNDDVNNSSSSSSSCEEEEE